MPWEISWMMHGSGIFTSFLSSLLGMSKSSRKLLLCIWVRRFTGREASNISPMAARIAYDTDIAVMIPLVSGHDDVLIAHLQSQGLSLSDAKEKLRSRKTCYVIFNSRHCHEAIPFFIVSDGIWASFKWTVTVIRLGLRNEKYRQFARMQIMSPSRNVYIRFTSTDFFFSLCLELDLLRHKVWRLMGQQSQRQIALGILRTLHASRRQCRPPWGCPSQW